MVVKIQTVEEQLLSSRTKVEARDLLTKVEHPYQTDQHHQSRSTTQINKFQL